MFQFLSALELFSIDPPRRTRAVPYICCVFGHAVLGSAVGRIALCWPVGPKRTAILTGVRWQRIVVLICISRLLNDVEHLFVYLLIACLSYLFLDLLVLCCCTGAFSGCSEQGLLCRCSVWFSHCNSVSCCAAWTLGMQASVVVALRFSTCGARA